jgi:sucrose-6-phosphate hydrolase SacC (GH32 family)
VEQISRRRFCGAAAALAADLWLAKAVDVAAGMAPDTSARVREIAAVRYAPPGRYMKDHCFVRRDGRWHLFAPLGTIGTSWEDLGSEETAEHMTSTDLVHWQHLGTAVAASRREGYFDKTMGGIAPHVIQHDGRYFMFYSGWSFPSKRSPTTPFNHTGYSMSIGLAVSRDLDHWEKPAEFAKQGLGVAGTDCCVVRDDAHGRWLMYTWTGQTAVYQSSDLWHWSSAGAALTSGNGLGVGGWGESPFVMRHPQSGKWIILLNNGYSLSDDPLRFPPLRPYPFQSGWHQVGRPTGAWGDGTNELADDDGAGFAHEVLEFAGQWYMTGVVGTDGHEKLKFTPIVWTKDSFRLAERS